MRIYTRKGDSGETGLFGGERVSKSHVRVEAYGAVDELNAVLGLAVVELDDALAARLRAIQADLFAVGAHLAAAEAAQRQRKLPVLPSSRVSEMEAWMDELDASLPALKAFILPGGSRAAAALHLARTVCRRAERRVVGLLEHAGVDGSVVAYLNRLSDLLFVLAREANRRAGVDDELWSPDGGADGA